MELLPHSDELYCTGTKSMGRELMARRYIDAMAETVFGKSIYNDSSCWCASVLLRYQGAPPTV